MSTSLSRPPRWPCRESWPRADRTCALSFRISNSNKAHLIAFEDQASQSSGGIGPGVDIDAVRTDFGFPGRRVAVHHDFAESLFVQQELFPYPEQILSTLLPQRNSRTHAGMGE